MSQVSNITKARIKARRQAELMLPGVVSNDQVVYPVTLAWADGSVWTKLSALIMGIGNLVRGQILKGLMFLAIEILFIVYMVGFGIPNLRFIPTLGWATQEEVWNESKGIFEYVGDSHQSVQILLAIVSTFFVIIGFIFIWRAAIRSSYMTDQAIRSNNTPSTAREDLSQLGDRQLHRSLLFLPSLGVLLFTILPLVYMMSMAFTNYSRVDDKLVLFDWVGLDTFKLVLSTNNTVGQTFWSVLGWTLVWAVFATGLNYIFGILLALLIERKDTKLKAFWRFCFVLTIAVPQFVSLLFMRQLLQPNGAVNNVLASWNFERLPFFTEATWARVTVIVINCWVGIPYTLLQVSGILKNIPNELYEAAKIDGAGALVIFRKITMPYIFFVTTPYLITQFTGNVNNFNVIYLLSGGGPGVVGRTAGRTDLLVTWLFKLTVDQDYYNVGAAIGIFTFIVLSLVALITYRRSGSYQNEEGFQ